MAIEKELTHFVFHNNKISVGNIVKYYLWDLDEGESGEIQPQYDIVKSITLHDGDEKDAVEKYYNLTMQNSKPNPCVYENDKSDRIKVLTLNELLAEINDAAMHYHDLRNGLKELLEDDTPHMIKMYNAHHKLTGF